MTLENFDCNSFKNPSMNKFINFIENYALNEEEKDKENFDFIINDKINIEAKEFKNFFNLNFNLTKSKNK